MTEPNKVTIDLSRYLRPEKETEMEFKKIYGNNGLGRKSGKPTKNEQANIALRLKMFDKFLRENLAAGMSKEEANNKAFEDAKRAV